MRVLSGPRQAKFRRASISATRRQFTSLPVQSQFATQLPFIQYEPLHPKSNAIFPHIEPGIEAVLLNLATPEEAMRDASRRVNQVLERP
jgi:maltose-binding protein MalE